MNATTAFIALLMSLSLAGAADKPVVYDHITKDDATGGGAELDQKVNAALAAKYTILPLEDSPAYVNTKATAGDMPRTARTESGEALKGYVLIAYVVTADGRADDPVVLKTTDERLNATAIKAMETWRFTPSTLNGAPIATTAAQEFNFKEEAPPKAFDTANIVLYQGNDVLEQRLPSAELLAAYIKQLQAVLTDYFANATTLEMFHTVVAVRPGKLVRVWFVSSKRSGTAPEFDALRKKLEAVEPIDVQGGPVAFAISGKIADGDSTSAPTDKNFQPPIPKEWQDAAKDLKFTVPMQDAYLNAVWPEKK